MPVTFEAQFLHGSPRMVDHTPGSDIAAGTVIVTADTPRIAHLDLTSGVLGALAAEGGVYLCTGDAAIAADKKVYWDNTNNKVTENAAAGVNKMFGVTVTACAANNGKCQVRHDPAA
jgi:predicted RecA/RadA family phage recombinase